MVKAEFKEAMQKLVEAFKFVAEQMTSGELSTRREEVNAMEVVEAVTSPIETAATETSLLKEDPPKNPPHEKK